MSEARECLREIQLAVDRLSRAIDLEEQMAKQNHERRSQAAAKVDELRRKGKFVRYKDGKDIYGMTLHKFMDVAKEAEAVYKVNGVCLVNIELLDKYLETFHVKTR